AGEGNLVVRVSRERALGDGIRAARHRLAGGAGQAAGQDRRGRVRELEAAGGVGERGVGAAVDLGLRVGRDRQGGRGDGDGRQGGRDRQAVDRGRDGHRRAGGRGGEGRGVGAVAVVGDGAQGAAAGPGAQGERDLQAAGGQLVA